mmetsp:Transcript_19221/g.62762  ORF Transcript_19221/g.62762 Transcript_19221/m.62762 type:complete len:337 (+) Transcript_19221:96-1106(+)
MFALPLAVAAAALALSSSQPMPVRDLPRHSPPAGRHVPRDGALPLPPASRLARRRPSRGATRPRRLHRRHSRLRRPAARLPPQREAQRREPARRQAHASHPRRRLLRRGHPLRGHPRLRGPRRHHAARHKPDGRLSARGHPYGSAGHRRYLRPSRPHLGRGRGGQLAAQSILRGGEPRLDRCPQRRPLLLLLQRRDRPSRLDLHAGQARQRHPRRGAVGGRQADQGLLRAVRPPRRQPARRRDPRLHLRQRACRQGGLHRRPHHRQLAARREAEHGVLPAGGCARHELCRGGLHWRQLPGGDQYSLRGLCGSRGCAEEPHRAHWLREQAEWLLSDW